MPEPDVARINPAASNGIASYEFVPGGPKNRTDAVTGSNNTIRRPAPRDSAHAEARLYYANGANVKPMAHGARRAARRRSPPHTRDDSLESAGPGSSARKIAFFAVSHDRVQDASDSAPLRRIRRHA